MKKIVAIGGALELSPHNKIIIEMFKLTGKTNPVVLIVPSSKDPQEIAEICKKHAGFFTSIGALALTSALPDDLETCQQLEMCDLVFLSGGSQSELLTSLNDTRFKDLLRAKVQNGEVVLAGTSAGCAAISQTMIRRGLVEPEIGEGLGLLAEVILDQHFSSGNKEYQTPRFIRLLKAVYQFPELLGVGIDEDTAIIVKDKEATVIGVGSVTLVDVSKSTDQPIACEADDNSLAAAGIVTVKYGCGDVFEIE